MMKISETVELDVTDGVAVISVDNPPVNALSKSVRDGLLEAVAKAGKPVLLKRHFGCSLRDWLGAAEYVLYHGNPSVVLCERGVAAPHTHNAASRFLADLAVVPAAQELTHLPILVDPSHATFRRRWVAPIARAALAVGADGIMLDVHPDPGRAAVDPLQALNYDAFEQLIRQLHAIAPAVGRRLQVEEVSSR